MTKKMQSIAMTVLIIILTSSLGDSINAMNPVLENISNEFPDLSYSLITLVGTIPNVTYIVAALIAGFFVGRKLKYKTIIVLGCICILIGGMLPGIWYESFALILTARLIFGIGLGLLAVLNAYVTEIFDGTARQKYLGWHTSAMNCGSIILLLLAGFLGGHHWSFAAYSYVLAIIPLIFAFFVKEPNELRFSYVSRSVSEAEAKGKKTMSPAAIGYFLVMIVVATALNCFFIVMAPFVIDVQGGTVFLTSVILCCYIFGGAVAGFVFEKMRKVFKKAFLCIVCLCIAFGAALVYFTGIYVLMGIGGFLCGVSFWSIMTICIELTALKSNEASVAFSTTMICVGAYLGCFLASPWTSVVTAVFGDLYKGVFVSIIVIHIIIAIIFFIKNPLKENTLSNSGEVI